MRFLPFFINYLKLGVSSDRSGWYGLNLGKHFSTYHLQGTTIRKYKVRVIRLAIVRNWLRWACSNRTIFTTKLAGHPIRKIRSIYVSDWLAPCYEKDGCLNHEDINIDKEAIGKKKNQHKKQTNNTCWFDLKSGFLQMSEHDRDSPSPNLLSSVISCHIMRYSRETSFEPKFQDLEEA